MRRRRVCFFTGSRAEYGLLRELILSVRNDDRFDLQLIVSGAHLSTVHGRTVTEIRADGLVPDEEVEIVLASDSGVAVCTAMGLALMGVARALQRLTPDFLIVLGDRYETFCAASAATVLNLPIVHLHGGEITEGAIDDCFRHAITKMSHLHFVATEECRRRVIQMGEPPETVITAGSLGVAAIRKLALLEQRELERDLRFSFGERSVLVTFHPATRNPGSARKQAQALLSALDRFPDLHVLFTGTNADGDGRAITAEIERFVAAHPGRTLAVPSLGQQRYFSAIRCVDAVVGNSSSGIIEVPSFGVPVVNIGDRQKGRAQASSIINCAPETGAIARAVERALSADMRRRTAMAVNPYERDNTLELIIGQLARWRPDSTVKTFYELRDNSHAQSG